MKDSSKLTFHISIGILSVLLVAVVVAIGVISRNRKSDISDISEDVWTADPDDPLSNVEIASIVVQWMEKSRHPDGRYIFDETFDESGVATKTVDHRLGAFPVWAQAKLFEKTGNTEHLSKIERDIDVYMDPEVVPFIQNYFWTCALLYDASIVPGLPEDIANKMRDLCERGDFNLELMQNVDDELEQGFVTFDVRVDQLPVSALSGAVESPLNHEIFQLAAFSADRSGRYRWYGKRYDREVATVLLRDAVELYSQEVAGGSFIPSDTRCVIGFAALNLYALSADESLVDLSELMFRSYEPSVDDVESLAFCTLLGSRLGQTGIGRVSDADISKMLDIAIFDLFDVKGYDGYYNGGGAFRDLKLPEARRSLIANTLLTVVLLERSDLNASK
ncbi:MAG: hypothetical protein PHG63_00580 [Candidatus Dojkabacteria bacterium]|nr:hypothetical protein [Candidatus Dojkabacteria bacterium]